MAKSRQKKMHKERTNLTLHGQDVELINKVKNHFKNITGGELSYIEIVRIALRALNKEIQSN